jgi:hypothetical protein
MLGSVGFSVGRNAGSAKGAAAAMAALGFGLPADAFTSRMALGPHLLAPTGSDLQQHGEKGTAVAGA